MIVTKVDNNTFLKIDGDGTQRLELHGHVIITWHVDGGITFDTCGFNTATTRDRMNKYTDYNINQKKGVLYCNGEPFTGNTFHIPAN